MKYSKIDFEIIFAFLTFTPIYQSKIINVDLFDSLHYDTDLGKIILAQKIKRLGEVTVITKKPLITQEIDRIIYILYIIYRKIQRVKSSICSK